MPFPIEMSGLSPAHHSPGILRHNSLTTLRRNELPRRKRTVYQEALQEAYLKERGMDPVGDSSDASRNRRLRCEEAWS
jgi:hypothetical protein